MVTECVSYDSSTYDSNTEYPTPAEACGDAAGQVTTSQFPVGGLCRTGTPFLQNIVIGNVDNSFHSPINNSSVQQIITQPDGKILVITQDHNIN